MSLETYSNTYFGESEKTLSAHLSSPPLHSFPIELLMNSTVMECDPEGNEYVQQSWGRLGNHL